MVKTVAAIIVADTPAMVGALDGVAVQDIQADLLIPILLAVHLPNHFRILKVQVQLRARAKAKPQQKERLRQLHKLLKIRAC